MTTTNQNVFFSGTDELAENISEYLGDVLMEWLAEYYFIESNFGLNTGVGGYGFPYASVLVQDYEVYIYLSDTYEFKIAVSDPDGNEFETYFADIPLDSYRLLGVDLLDDTVDFLANEYGLEFELVGEY